MQLMNLLNGLRITFDLNVICIALSLIMPRQSLADELDFKKLGLNDTFKQDILNIEGIGIIMYSMKRKVRSECIIQQVPLILNR